MRLETERLQVLMSPGKRAALVFFLLATLACLGCDQLTKNLARTHLDAGGLGPTLAFGTVQFTLVQNPGAFMSIGSALPGSVRQIAFLVCLPVVMLGLSIAFLRQPLLSTAEATALACVVGGGVGNWLDRLLNGGAVTDFVIVGIGPIRSGVFNVADLAILFGAGALVALRWRSPRRDAGWPDPCGG